MYFFDLVEKSKEFLKEGEEFICSLNGESSDFVRLNQGKIRQAGNVQQNIVHLEFIQGKRHIASSFNLCGEQNQDLEIFSSNFVSARNLIQSIPEDPYFYFCPDIHQSHQQRRSDLANSRESLEQILESCQDMDLVGIFAQGSLSRAFSSSFGHQHWFESDNFNFDWSCYLGADKAVKSSYAGFEWQKDILFQKMEDCRKQLSLLKRPPIDLQPGAYPSYLSPSALQELMSLLAWGGFGTKSHRSLQTPLLKMIKEDQLLDPRIQLTEDNQNGVGPHFTHMGFIKPNQVDLIKNGRYHQTLVSPRSAKEFNMPVNSGSEFPESLRLQGGKLNNSSVLQQLDEGLLINNLWYCNYSDRNNCRITGMTRFACFWVKGGEIQAPVNVMRFDDSIYNILGNNLVDLSKERDFIFDNNTYTERSTDSYLLPGILIDRFNLTL